MIIPNRLWGSVSGGLTSMKMAHDLKHELGGKCELRFVFSNTGEEDHRTLDFVQRCDDEWGLGIVWVEAVVNPGRKGCTHRIVTYETASRNGEPFEAMIQKYGIPNKSYPHCNRELKLNPMLSYIRSIGWGDAHTAVGIRADEPKRLSDSAESRRIVYPFAHWWPHDKQDVRDWWEDQPFTLGLEEREGNCKWCWKKSEKKHFANIAADPSRYEFPRRMEKLYGSNRPERGPQVFFRGAMSTDDLFRQYEAVGFDARYLPSIEETGSCSESCEAFQHEAKTGPFLPDYYADDDWTGEHDMEEYDQ